MDLNGINMMDYKTRNINIVSKFIALNTTAEIARQYKISRERTRQIIYKSLSLNRIKSIKLRRSKMKTAQRNKKFVDMYHNNKEFREKLQTKARERYHIVKGKTNFR